MQNTAKNPTFEIPRVPVIQRLLFPQPGESATRRSHRVRIDEVGDAALGKIFQLDYMGRVQFEGKVFVDAFNGVQQCLHELVTETLPMSVHKPDGWANPADTLKVDDAELPDVLQLDVHIIAPAGAMDAVKDWIGLVDSRLIDVPGKDKTLFQQAAYIKAWTDLFGSPEKAKDLYRYGGWFFMNPGAPVFYFIDKKMFEGTKNLLNLTALPY